VLKKRRSSGGTSFRKRRESESSISFINESSPSRQSPQKKLKLQN